MKSKEYKELKSKDKKELNKMVYDKKNELTKFSGSMYAGKEKNLKKGKNLRRDIAQILTVLSFEKKSTTKKDKTE